MTWRAKQPAVVRWIEVLGLFALVLGARVQVGTTMHGVFPALSFYPVLLIVSLLFGWREAVTILILSVTAGIYLVIQPEMYLQPFGWIFVGGLTITIITALKMLAEELAAANERQAILFRELQHRVANTLQSVVNTLERAQMRLDTAPDQVRVLLEEAATKFAASADVHRRLHDPTLFQQGLGAVLRDAVEAVVDPRIKVSIDVAPLRLSMDQMSIVAMLVIEAANNAQKHVFRFALGHNFSVSLKATGEIATLSVKDDGPGWTGATTRGSLGLSIMQGLTKQIGGQLTIEANMGTETSIKFPLL